MKPCRGSAFPSCLPFFRGSKHETDLQKARACTMLAFRALLLGPVCTTLPRTAVTFSASEAEGSPFIPQHRPFSSPCHLLIASPQTTSVRHPAAYSSLSRTGLPIPRPEAHLHCGTQLTHADDRVSLQPTSRDNETCQIQDFCCQQILQADRNIFALSSREIFKWRATRTTFLASF